MSEAITEKINTEWSRIYAVYKNLSFLNGYKGENLCWKRKSLLKLISKKTTTWKHRLCWIHIWVSWMRNSKGDLYLKILNNNQKSNNWIFGHISFNRIQKKKNLSKRHFQPLKEKPTWIFCKLFCNKGKLDNTGGKSIILSLIDNILKYDPSNFFLFKYNPMHMISITWEMLLSSLHFS